MHIIMLITDYLLSDISAFIVLILEAKAEVLHKFGLLFGRFECIKISSWDLLTFKMAVLCSGAMATENWIGEIAIQSSTNWMSPSYNFLFKEEGKVIMFSYLLMHNGLRSFLEWDCQFDEIWARPMSIMSNAPTKPRWFPRSLISYLQ